MIMMKALTTSLQNRSNMPQLPFPFAYQPQSPGVNSASILGLGITAPDAILSTRVKLLVTVLQHDSPQRLRISCCCLGLPCCAQAGHHLMVQRSKTC